MDKSLKQIKFQLQDILNKLEWKSEQKGASNSPTFQISGLTNIRDVINKMSQLELFTNNITFLKNSAIYTSSNDSMNIQITEANSIISNLNQLKTLATNFLEILIKSVPPEDVNSINIKLPNVKDFDELSKVSRDIHLSISQIIFNDEIKGETKIVSVENGSIWFNVFVGANAVVLLASVTWAAAVIYKKIQEGRMLEQQIRSMKVKNESLMDILKAQKAETDLMITAEAEHIQTEFFKKNANENLERIKNSISTFADLIGKGAEIHPALVAPENVSNLFPNTSQLIGLESKIKRLSKTTEN